MSKNTPKPDDCYSTLGKFLFTSKNTIGNMEAAEETKAFSDGKELEAIREKNARREASIEGFRAEIKDETEARKNGRV